MKKYLLVLFSATLTVGFFSCKKEVDNTELCYNNIKDGDETEIDCGGTFCEPCLPAGRFSCTINGIRGVANFTSENAAGQVLGPSVRIYGTNSGNMPFNFMFIPSELNQPIQISSSNFNYAGEAYTKSSSDTGTVVITAHDTLRHIISGRFSLAAQRVTKDTRCTVNNGEFTNVRYHCKECNPPY